MTPRFLYLVPKESRHRLPGESRVRQRLRLLFNGRRQRPSGGAKIIYRHCELLQALGHDAAPVHLGRFQIDWFSHRLQPLALDQALRESTPDDIVVCPEVIPRAADAFAGRRSILFVQGWSLVDANALADSRFERLLTVSRFCREYLRKHTTLPCHCVTNGIDLNRFAPAPQRRMPRRVLYLARKRPELAQVVRDRVQANIGHDVQFVGLENRLTEAEMIQNYQATDVFLTLSYPEGFGLPPLEAMACGCAVVGFSGGGGAEHMIDGVSAAVADDGDAEGAADKLERLLNDADYREMIRKGGMDTAHRFGLDRMTRELATFVEDLSVEQPPPLF